MAIFRLNIGQEPKWVEPAGKKPFMTFRAAENQGEGREPLWFEVLYFPQDPLDADMLVVGQYIEVYGRIDATVAKTKDGKIYLNKNGEPVVNLKIVTGKVKVIEKKEKADAPA